MDLALKARSTHLTVFRRLQEDASSQRMKLVPTTTKRTSPEPNSATVVIITLEKCSNCLTEGDQEGRR
jgi:hypothetical protein